MFSINTHKPVSLSGLSVSKHQFQALPSLKIGHIQNNKDISPITKDLVRTLTSRRSDLVTVVTLKEL